MKKKNKHVPYKYYLTEDHKKHLLQRIEEDELKLSPIIEITIEVSIFLYYKAI